MRWIVGLTLGFLTMIGVNAVMIYLAVTTPNPVVQSYVEADR